MTSLARILCHSVWLDSLVSSAGQCTAFLFSALCWSVNDLMAEYPLILRYEIIHRLIEDSEQSRHIQTGKRLYVFSSSC